jgi:integrase
MGSRTKNSAASRSVEGYGTFLREQRGLSPRVIAERVRIVERFIQHMGGVPASSLTPSMIDAFMLKEGKRRSRRGIGGITDAVRSFLRYLFLSGEIATDLAPRVITPKLYRLESIPLGMPWPEAIRLLDSVDQQTPTGRRDYAILLMLALYGFRSCEVRRLELEDIDWERETIRIQSSKGAPVRSLPLHPAVAAALVSYLKNARPESPFRVAFLTARRKIGPLGKSAIGMMIAGRLKRAGIGLPRHGAHQLRHATAINLQAKGFSLKAIGDFLGHQHPQSTFTYAKAAIEDLREVALDLEGVVE